MNDIYLRTCLFHPNKLATTWSGHIHLTLRDKIHIIVGLCKECRIHETNNNNLSNQRAKGCMGCYGILDNGLR